MVTEYIKISLEEVSFWFYVLRIFPEAEGVREWFKDHVLDQSNDGPLLFTRDDDGKINPSPPWEDALFKLAIAFSSFAELTEWESALSEERNVHCQKVAKRARELAELLESKPGLEYPRPWPCSTRNARSISSELSRQTGWKGCLNAVALKKRKG